MAINLRVQHDTFSMNTEVVASFNDIEILRATQQQLLQTIVTLTATKMAELLVAKRGEQIMATITDETITKAVIESAVNRVREELRGSVNKGSNSQT